MGAEEDRRWRRGGEGAGLRAPQGRGHWCWAASGSAAPLGCYEKINSQQKRSQDWIKRRVFQKEKHMFDRIKG